MLKNRKGQFDFTRAQSWSQLSCFDNPDYPEYSDKEKWYQRYVLKIKEPPTKQLLFGSFIDKKIQDDLTFLPQLERFPHMQYEMKVTYNNIPLIGYADGWNPTEKRLKDDKTGETPWTQERADKTGQITFYLFMLYLIHGVKPEDVVCQIDWIPTETKPDFSIGLVEPATVKTFKTKRTMRDILKFAGYVERTYAAMQEYVKNHD